MFWERKVNSTNNFHAIIEEDTIKEHTHTLR